MLQKLRACLAMSTLLRAAVPAAEIAKAMNARGQDCYGRRGGARVRLNNGMERRPSRPSSVP